MFWQKKKDNSGKDSIYVGGLGKYSLKDSFECGQCFRYQRLPDDENGINYMTVIGEKLVFLSQKAEGEILFHSVSEKEFTELIAPYFDLDTDYTEINGKIKENTDSEWLRSAAEYGAGIAIFRQDSWEALFSFIVSQNNNIPRIRKIIGEICYEYGVNLCLQNGIKACPLGKIDSTPCHENCKNCGFCYSFPKPKEIVEAPEKLLVSKPGFRYKYLINAARAVHTGEVNLEKIAAARAYTYTVSELIKIKGVGNKVASCVALFGFGNLDAFPIDVWMKRAIDEYFNGSLDPKTLGRYAGLAQQYIFHYIRKITKEEKASE